MLKGAMPLSTKMQFVLQLYAFCSHGLIETTWEDDTISYKRSFLIWMARIILEFCSCVHS